MEKGFHYQGLNAKDVLKSREKYGSNILTPPKRDPLWKLFLEKFNDPIIRILLIAAFLSLGISFIHNEFIETIGIFCAIFLATGVSFWFEMDANKKFDLLNQVNDETLVKVIRDGNISEIPKKDVVVGDIIILDTGEEVPADGELAEAVSLSVNESSLTGEPVIEKSINPEYFDKEATYPTNHILRGTTIVEGHCIYEVFAVGDSTEFGKVAEKSTEANEEETPLNKQLAGLAKFIGFVGFVLAILTFTILFVKDLFMGEADFKLGQIGLLGAVILGVVISGVKVWMPILYDGFEIMGKKTSLPKGVKEGSWLKWLLSGILTTVIIASAGYLFGVDPLDGSSWISIDVASRILQYFMVAVTLIVVAVPEGLPMSVTLSLALSMRRMLQTNNLVRKMHATETMGAATVICTDKTGTLTQNQMRVADTNFSGLKDQNLDEGEQSILIKENISANSTAFLDFSDPQKIKTLGNPTEAAMLLWLHEHNINYLEVREGAKIIDQLTFSTERKYMATIVDSAGLDRKVLYVKGAPEIVISKCKDAPERINDKLLQYQNQAMRTLGFAYKILSTNLDHSIEDLASGGLSYLGVVAISDPVREDVPEAVAKCLRAGIDVKIVTGDTPGTAKEIGRQIGILSADDGEEVVITGVDFEKLTDEEALSRVLKLKIMCRARPADKQRLVQLLQKAGAVVAVTGDGTNDAPALNHAHVGLSMGTGTSVAKEASDITLLDDSFNSIATAVMWGRSLYQNIQRFILFQLTINVTALIIVLLGSIFGHELPLTVTQMLWVNLIMDTFAAGALASLPPNSKVMESKPRRSTDFIVTPSMRRNILFTGILFVALLFGLLFHFTDAAGNISRYDLSIFFTVFVMLQFWNMFNAKTYGVGGSAFKGISKCPGFVLVAVLIVVGQFLIVQFGGAVFRTEPLSLKDWLVITGSTSVVLWVGEITRLVKKLIKR
ncbi:MAG: calcium-translocating P-type ATPase, PMCA-type [Bacteroidales bacterium]